MSFAVATANFWATIVSLTFPRILTALKAEGSFTLYAALNVLAVLLVFLLLPETRLKTLDELDEVFSIPSQVFMKYQLMEYLPYIFTRYIVRKKGAGLRPLTLEREYHELEQEDEDAIDGS